MPSTTSAARRKPTCTFGFSTIGRPRRFQDWYCFGNVSLKDLARAKSSSVNSGASSSLLIAFPFASVSLSQRDGPQRRAAHGEGEDMEPTLDRPDSPEAGFPVVTPLVGYDPRRLEIHRRSGSERDAVLLAVNLVLLAVELDPHPVIIFRGYA